MHGSIRYDYTWTLSSALADNEHATTMVQPRIHRVEPRRIDPVLPISWWCRSSEVMMNQASNEASYTASWHLQRTHPAANHAAALTSDALSASCHCTSVRHHVVLPHVHCRRSYDT
eukprot:scaffold647952_cov52-Prasinocladus_malaysianus.AAC.1